MDKTIKFFRLKWFNNYMQSQPNASSEFSSVLAIEFIFYKFISIRVF